MSNEEILKTEYHEQFDNLRKDRMIQSFYKYGPLKENYTNELIDAVKSLEMRLQMYKSTGNTEFLCDVANFAMIEFMYPQHPEAHFKAQYDDQNHIVGISVNQMKGGIYNGLRKEY